MSRYFIYCLLFVLLSNITVSCTMQSHDEKETAGGWIKYDSNPVLGGDLAGIAIHSGADLGF